MAGLFSYSFTGVAFIAIGALESLYPSAVRIARPLTLLRFRLLLTASLSATVLLSSLLSAAVDRSVPAIPLSVAAASALFLLYALSGLAAVLPSPSAPLVRLPSPLLDLLLAAAFFQELLLLRLRRKDPDGLENHYFDLLLVPVVLSAFATLLGLYYPRHFAPRLARGIGLILHGTWLVQMGFSFFSSILAHGCQLHRRSWSNYTVTCKIHEDAHRSMAIATLQFNCHLALLVVVAVAAYSLASGKREGQGPGYQALAKELHHTGNNLSHFTLESDDEEREIVEEAKMNKRGEVLVSLSQTNGHHGSSH